MPERDRKILNSLELSPELTTDEVVQSIRAVLREYYMFVATTSAGRGGGPAHAHKLPPPAAGRHRRRRAQRG